MSNVSLARYFALFWLMFCYANSQGQLTLNFNSGNINDVKWEGNISHFRINPEGQLQLNAPVAGESSVYTKFKVPADSIRIDLYFKLQFAPSNDNFGKIYLFTDNVAEAAANGYYLRLGENGSNDAIQVWKLSAGVPTLMASGRMGGISADPADARLSIKIYRNGLWLMDTDYTGGNVLEQDLEFMDPQMSLPDSMYFGIYCKYTSSRTDKFFYDDIVFKTVEKDTVPPAVAKAEIQSDSRIKLTFTEVPSESSVTNVANYELNNGAGRPVSVSYNSSMPTMAILNFGPSAIQSGKYYRLSVSGIRDKAGNTRAQTLDFVFPVSPSRGDLVINELLADPYTGGEDFVELYNNSLKFIKLDSLILRNADKAEEKLMLTDMVLFPGQYVAVSKNPSFLMSTYQTPDTARFLTATIPSLNIDEGNISIISRQGSSSTTIDSFDYREDMHFILIDETKGVSLERIRFGGDSNDPNNWHSAATQVRFATPGYKNSNHIDGTGVPTGLNTLTPDRKVITPDGDGNDDFVLLQYKLDKAGYLATVRIFDSEGFPVTDLANNFLLGTEGALRWDGVDGENNYAKIGPYIILTRLLHPDGEVREFRNLVVVAQKF